MIVPATEENVGKAESSFARMKANGVNVPICLDHSLKAKDTYGRLMDLSRRDGWLEGTLQFIGDDALVIAARNELSVGIKPILRDGFKNEYPFAIEHVALTPIPVVPFQDGYQTLAASRAADGETVFLLSSAPDNPPKEPVMAKTSLSPAHKQACMEHLKASGEPGVTDDMDDDAATNKLLELHGKQHRDIDRLKAGATAMMSRAGVEIDWTGDGWPKMQESFDLNLSRLETEKDEAETKALNLSRATAPKTTDPEVIHERCLRVRSSAFAKWEKTHTPADIKRISDYVAGTPEAPNTMTLSRAEGQADCFAAGLIDLLAECRPVPQTGEQTGAYLMSRATHNRACRRKSRKPFPLTPARRSPSPPTNHRVLCCREPAFPTSFLRTRYEHSSFSGSRPEPRPANRPVADFHQPADGAICAGMVLFRRCRDPRPGQQSDITASRRPRRRQGIERLRQLDHRLDDRTAGRGHRPR